MTFNFYSCSRYPYIRPRETTFLRRKSSSSLVGLLAYLHNSCGYGLDWVINWASEWSFGGSFTLVQSIFGAYSCELETQMYLLLCCNSGSFDCYDALLYLHRHLWIPRTKVGSNFCPCHCCRTFIVDVASYWSSGIRLVAFGLLLDPCWENVRYPFTTHPWTFQCSASSRMLLSAIGHLYGVCDSQQDLPSCDYALSMKAS